MARVTWRGFARFAPWEMTTQTQSTNGSDAAWYSGAAIRSSTMGLEAIATSGRSLQERAHIAVRNEDAVAGDVLASSWVANGAVASAAEMPNTLRTWSAVTAAKRADSTWTCARSLTADRESAARMVRRPLCRRNSQRAPRRAPFWHRWGNKSFS
jgi:hypothetical protein